jgi:peptide/nickel transport system permease protein
MTGPLEGLPAPAARPEPSGRPRRRAGTSLVVGALLVGLVAATALLSFVWTPHDPLRIDAAARLLGPTAEHPLGTDRFGRDTLSLLMLGARTTLLVGSLSVGLAALVGVPLGLLAATAGGWVDGLLMRANDLLLAFPALLLAIMLAAVFGGGTVTATAAIAVATVPAFARVTRAGALRVLRTDYVLAARAAGRSRPDIAVRHVLPNVGGTLVVQASVSFAIAVLAEAALNFLGFGTQPPTPSWGRMLQESQEFLYDTQRLALVPGLAIAAAVLGFNLLGDGLRDRFDPRLEGR